MKRKQQQIPNREKCNTCLVFFGGCSKEPDGRGCEKAFKPIKNVNVGCPASRKY